jgi:hypothetical protein
MGGKTKVKAFGARRTVEHSARRYGPCIGCGTKISDRYWCWGCSAYICDSCDVFDYEAIGAAIRGAIHTAQAHLAKERA